MSVSELHEVWKIKGTKSQGFRQNTGCLGGMGRLEGALDLRGLEQWK